jgi:beta-lactamase regulating signal transducer with metallopeptidase domain
LETLANPLVSSIAGAFVSSVWQGLVIAFVLSIFMKLTPRIPAASRFAVWAAGFLVAASLPVFPFLASLASKVGHEAIANSAAREAGSPVLQVDLRWSTVIVGFWAAAALYRVVDLAIHTLRLRKLWKNATPIDIDETFAGTVAQIGRARVQICSTQMLERPGVIGFLAPRILIPEWLLERLTPEELKQVVLHEVEHLRRHDDWTNLAQKLLMVVFPINPALWWMERKLCREREMACDEGVVRVTHAPRAYAACLASLAERGLQQRAEALSLGAWQRRSELAHRVHGILLRKKALRPVASATLLGALGCGLVAGSVEFARCPQLVTFVPSQNHEAANKDVVAVSTQGDAVFHDGRNLASGFHAVEAKAVVPAAGAAGHALANTQLSSGQLKHLAPASTKLASTSLAKAEKPAAPKSDKAQQEWIVFTSMEQVGPVDRGGQLTADYDTTVSGDSAIRDSASTDEWKSQMGDQMTVTRLLLRMLPPSSFPAQPDPASFRNGWFVIQL